MKSKGAVSCEPAVGTREYSSRPTSRGKSKSKSTRIFLFVS